MMSRMINMFARRLMREAMNKGMDMGVKAATGGSTREEDMTPEQRRTLKERQKRTKQMTRVARRVGRF